MFNKIDLNETLRISDKAVTPMWLTKKMYTKVDLAQERKKRKQELKDEAEIIIHDVPDVIWHYFY